MLRRMLKLSGFNVVVAPTAKEALIALSELPVRVAVIDYNLPDHDGVWLLEHMNDDPPLGGRAYSSVLIIGSIAAAIVPKQRDILHTARPLATELA